MLGILLGLVGQLGSVFTLQQIGLVTAIVGIVLALTGVAALRLLWMPLLLLYLHDPAAELPAGRIFSAGMQLLSSSLGVWFMRLIGISVYLEGNVIDLGEYKLQVVEACDGLRYLFPLLTLGLVLAYFYKGAMWKRVLIFLSSIPITILMNSLRIAMIGVMVERWGPSHGRGLPARLPGLGRVHGRASALMVLLMIVLSRVGRDAQAVARAVRPRVPRAAGPRGAAFTPRPLPPTRGRRLSGAGGRRGRGARACRSRAEVVPSRAQPSSTSRWCIGPWFGERGAWSPMYVQALQLRRLPDGRLPRPGAAAGEPLRRLVRLAARRALGALAAHLPAGRRLADCRASSRSRCRACRRRASRCASTAALIALGESRQLVYYWFQQRGRMLTNEYLAKWYLFWDSLTRNRSDGALVRLIVPLAEGEQRSNADAELAQFAAELEPVLRTYVPR